MPVGACFTANELSRGPHSLTGVSRVSQSCRWAQCFLWSLHLVTSGMPWRNLSVRGSFWGIHSSGCMTGFAGLFSLVSLYYPLRSTPPSSGPPFCSGPLVIEFLQLPIVRALFICKKIEAMQPFPSTQSCTILCWSITDNFNIYYESVVVRKQNGKRFVWIYFCKAQ